MGQVSRVARTVKFRLGWSVAASALLLLGCDVFDESLIPGEAAPPVELGELLVGENIECNVPLNGSYNNYHAPIDTAINADDRSQLPECLGNANAPGNDVFFRISMKRGEKWHFHVDATDTLDPAIYILDSCSDSRSCAGLLSGINACGPTLPEHFSFIATKTADHIVGIDSLTTGGEDVRLLAVRAECGNGIQEHSEYCDDAIDGRPTDCAGCRKTLADGADDAGSFNDGPLDAAVLLLPEVGDDGAEFSITGTLEKSCDFDFFSFELAEPTSVRVRLENDDDVCDGWDVRIDDDQHAFAVDEPSTDGACPEVRAELDAGRHWVRVAGSSDLEAQKPTYTLDLELDLL